MENPLHSGLAVLEDPISAIPAAIPGDKIRTDKLGSHAVRIQLGRSVILASGRTRQCARLFHTAI